MVKNNTLKIWYSPKNKVILQPKERNILYGEYK